MFMIKTLIHSLVYAASYTILTQTLDATVVSEGFAPGVTFPANSEPLNISVADLDADGRPDVTVANFITGVSILRNASSPGNPSLQAPIFYATAIGAMDVKFDDLDGDGKLDMVVVVAGGVSVFRNTSSLGAITFAPRADFVFGSLSLPNEVAVSDYDGDGKPDLAFLNHDDSVLRVMKNVASRGTLSTASFILASQLFTSRAFAISSGDFNGDGRPDLLPGSQNSSRFLLNSTSAGNLTFSSVSSIPGIRTIQDAQVDNILTGEFDGNGLTDLVVRLGSLVTMFRNTSTNIPLTFEIQRLVGAWTAIGTGHLDVDNRLDIITANRFEQRIAVHTNNISINSLNTNGFLVHTQFATLNKPFALSVGDIDGDLRDDIITSSTDGPGMVTVYRNLLNHAPIANAGPDQVLECSQGSAFVMLDSTGTTDPDGDQLSYTWFDGTKIIGVGTRLSIKLNSGVNTIRLAVTDSWGASSDDTVEIVIRDQSSPKFAMLDANPSSLWPANGKMVPIKIIAKVTDDCDTAPQVHILSVRSTGDAKRGQSDWEITGPLSVNLRAERSGRDLEKNYAIDVEAIDTSGNRSTNVIVVTVPHDAGLNNSK